jgi:hypothetical protein
MISLSLRNGRRHALWLSLAFSASFFSCQKEVEPVDDSTEYPEYIIFGRYTEASWCSGETCVELFKIDTHGLYEDVLDLFPEPGSLQATQMDLELTKTDYDNIIAILKNHNYEKLFDQSDHTLGTLFEEGFHFYFEFKSKARHESWIIDGSFDGSVSQSLQPLLLDLNSMVQIAQF